MTEGGGWRPGVANLLTALAGLLLDWANALDPAEKPEGMDRRFYERFGIPWEGDTDDDG